jgi:hypothetical protein
MKLSMKGPYSFSKRKPGAEPKIPISTPLETIHKTTDQIRGLGAAVESMFTAEPISQEISYKLRQSGNLVFESRMLKTEFHPGD